jgi:hypothetical protein
MPTTASQLQRHALTSLCIAASIGVCALATHARADGVAQAAPSAPSNAQGAEPAAPAATSPESNAAGPAAPVERPSALELHPPHNAPVPPEPTLGAETRRISWPNVPLLATGASVLGASYLPAVIGAAVTDRHDQLYVPVAGPWLTLSRGPEEKAGYKALLAVDGVAQGLGALALLSSFFVPERATQHWPLIGRVQLVPARVAKGFGFAAQARF